MWGARRVNLGPAERKFCAQVNLYCDTQFTLLDRMNVRLIYHVVRLWIARHVHCEANSRDVAISLNLRRTHRLGLRRLDFFDRPLICLPAGGPHIAPAAELYRQDKGHPHLLAGRCEPPAEKQVPHRAFGPVRNDKSISVGKEKPRSEEQGLWTCRDPSRKERAQDERPRLGRRGLRAQYMPSIPPPPCPPGMGASFFSGISATRASVVSISAAIEPALVSAVRTTFVGSSTPALTRSS